MTGDARRSGEFERIARYFAPLAETCPGALGLKDDAAVVTPAPGCEFVVTTDTIVAGVHYVGDEPPDLVAAKLLRVNLSDLAAKGAEPRAYTLNIALPRDVDDAWLEKFSAGLAEDQTRFDIVLIGGDSVSTTGPAVFTLTAFGEVPAGGAILRSGARPGDRVFVSGAIGDGVLGLRAMRGELDDLPETDRAALAERYRRPEPRVALGRRLRGVARAAADVSDGLVADLGHIVEASDTGATVAAEAVPLSDAARAVLDAGASDLQTVLTGGDDYELVFCVPSDRVDRLAAIGREAGVPVTEIGEIVEGAGVRVLDRDGAPLTLGRAGYAHG